MKSRPSSAQSSRRSPSPVRSASMAPRKKNLTPPHRHLRSVRSRRTFASSELALPPQLRPPIFGARPVRGRPLVQTRHLCPDERPSFGYRRAGGEVVVRPAREHNDLEAVGFLGKQCAEPVHTRIVALDELIVENDSRAQVLCQRQPEASKSSRLRNSPDHRSPFADRWRNP